MARIIYGLIFMFETIFRDKYSVGQVFVVVVVVDGGEEAAGTLLEGTLRVW